VTEAYVLIKSDLGAEDDVLKEIRMIPEVKETHQIYGVYDIIIRRTRQPKNLPDKGSV